MYVAIYCRISQDKSERAEGVAAQEKRGRSYAADRWPDLPVRVFTDNDLSGANPDVHRPEFEALLDAVRRGEVAQVVVAEQSRLTRQPAQWEQVCVTLAKADINEVHAYRSGPIAVAGSRLLGRILAAVDAEEVERTRARVRDRLNAKAHAGEPAGSRSYGYCKGIRDDGVKTLIVIDEEAQAARLAADLILKGWSLASVAERLNEAGAPTARGGRWTGKTVRSLLLSPTIAGQRVHRGEIIGVGNWEPIISPDRQAAIRTILTEQRTTVRQADGSLVPVNRKRPPARKHLLTGGIARCGRDGCGAALVATIQELRSGTRRPLYKCSGQHGGCDRLGIVGEPLEEYVVARVLAHLDRPEFLARLTVDSGQHERQAATERLAAITAQRGELARLWAHQEISAAEWSAARASLDEDEALAARCLATHVAADAVDWSEIHAEWKELTLAEQRHALIRLGVQVTVRPVGRGPRSFSEDRVALSVLDTPI